MNRNLTIWITGALFVVLLPLFFVALEGMTRPPHLSAARMSETKDESGPKQNMTESERSKDLKGATDTALVESVEAMHSDQRFRPDQVYSAAAEPGSAIPESFISDLGYFGGATDSLRGEDLVATVVGPSSTAGTEPDSTGAVSSAGSGTPETAATDSSLPPHPKSEKGVEVPIAGMPVKKPVEAKDGKPVKKEGSKKRINATGSKSRSFAREKKSSTSTKRSSGDFAAARESRLLL
jgi:hypothetical protein